MNFTTEQAAEANSCALQMLNCYEPEQMRAVYTPYMEENVDFWKSVAISMWDIINGFRYPALEHEGFIQAWQNWMLGQAWRRTLTRESE